jgi:hypothetical protein
MANETTSLVKNGKNDSDEENLRRLKGYQWYGFRKVLGFDNSSD